MDKPKLRLNIRSPNEDKSASLSQAAKTKRDNAETIDEAWARIYQSKITNADRRKLDQVKQAMDEGEITRDPSEMFNKRGTPKKFSKAEALRLFPVIEETERKRRISELVETKPDNYILINDEESLERIINVLNNEELIVFDVETTGTDVWSDQIVGHVLSATSIDEHYYIPTDHNDKTVVQLRREYVARKLKVIYERKDIGFIAHNAKFDIAMLKNNFDISINNLHWDTQEAQRLLNENESSYALKPLVTKYLRDNSHTYGELFGDRGFHEVSIEEALAYAAKDGDVTYRLYKFQEYHMKRVGNIFEYFTTVEMPLMDIVSRIELGGYVIDDERAAEYEKELEASVAEMSEIISRELGDINLNSPQQLKPAIEEVIGKTIKDTNANNTLKPLSKDYPIIKTLLNYREDSKTLNNYVKAIPKLKKITGRIHAGLHQNGTVTGRFSSGEEKNSVTKEGIINIQNQSPESRSLFVAPPGKLIVNADFSAQEVRIIASLSQEEVLLNAFSQGVDAYATLASEFFGRPYEECYKNPDGSDTEARKQMKVVLLSSMYGASKWGLSNSLGISVDQAEEFRQDFFNKYRRIDAFIKDSQDFAKRNGFVWIGDKQRKRRLPDARKNRVFIPYGKWNNPEYEEAKKLNSNILKSMRQSPNAKVQGLAAIQTKVTMLKMDDLIKSKGWDWFAPIHDEIVLITNDNISEGDIAEINEVMTTTYLLEGVDNATDIEIQKRWGSTITSEEYLSGKEVPKL